VRTPPAAGRSELRRSEGVAYGEDDIVRVKKSFAYVIAFRRDSQLKP
jgi:hypothetical protein